jgi:hypothetical protein
MEESEIPVTIDVSRHNFEANSSAKKGNRPWRPIVLKIVEAPIFLDKLLTDCGKVSALSTGQPPFFLQEDSCSNFC